MAANPSLQAFKKIVTVDWPAHQERAAREHLLRAASDGHQKIMGDAQARAGMKPDFDAYANTPGNTNLQSVKLPGPIVFRYRYIREVVNEAVKLLRAASPVQSGDYVRGHQIFMDGMAVDALPISLKTTAEIMIVNTVPYSRRIEVGKTKSGRAFVLQVPNRIYERTGRRLKTLFKDIASIEIKFVSLPSAYTLKRNQKSRSFGRGGVRVSARQRQDRVSGAAITYPALIIRTTL